MISKRRRIRHTTKFTLVATAVKVSQYPLAVNTTMDPIQTPIFSRINLNLEAKSLKM